MRRALALTAATALLAAGGTTTAAGATTQLRFFTVQTAMRDTDDGFLVVEKVLQNGRRVGTDRLVCTAGKRRFDCRMTVRLTGRGQIKLTTVVREAANVGPLEIVGGTGEFAGASGTGNYKDLSDVKTRVTLTITT